MASRGQKAIQRARQAMFVTFSHYGELHRLKASEELKMSSSFLRRNKRR